MVILALAVRGAFQQERALDPDRYDFPAGMDEYNYDRLAAANAAGRSFFPGEIYSLPGYPALLTVLYRAGGRNPDLARGLQAFLGALGCGLTFLIGRKFLGPGGGLLAGLLLVFYGPALFFEGRLLPATAALFFTLAALTWWVFLPRRDCPWSWTGGGILLGAAAIFAPGNLAYALLLALIVIPRKGPALAVGAREALTLVGVLAVVLPFAVRNSRLAGGPVLLTAHSGINFYIGNNPESNGGFLTPLFLTPSATGIIVDGRREAERLAGRELSPAEVSRFWFREGVGYLASNPGAGLRNWGKKLRLAFSPREYFDIGGEAGGGDPIRLLGLPLLSFGFLLPAALFGLFLLPREGTSRRTLYCCLAGQVLAILLYYHQGRSRLPIVPILAVAAAAAVQFCWRALRDMKPRRLAVALPVLLLLALVIRERGRAEMRSETNLLISLAQKEIILGNEVAAREMVDRALALHPGLGGADLVRGAIAEREGDFPEAEGWYLRAGRGDHFSPDPDLRLSLLYLEQGEEERALAAARRARERDPLSWRAGSLMADVSFSRGEREDAYRHLRRAVELNPNSARDHQNLALIYREAGDPVMAEYHQGRAERLGNSNGDQTARR